MNDRFKFRAWHKPTKRLFEVWCFTPEYVFEHDEINGIGSPTNPARLEDCELIQCTGLKDESGNLIYEGDIVKFSFIDEVDFGNFGAKSRIKYIGKGKIIFESGCFVLINLKTNYKIPCFDDKLRFIKIIGNIHENPELLEEHK